MGLVISYFKEDPSPIVGTGFLVDRELVVTTAHNLYRKNKIEHSNVDKVAFIPNGI